MNLDPNWVGAIGQWAGAVATVAAVIVALREARGNSIQSRQDRYDAAHPVLIVSNGNIRTQPGLSGWLDWNASDQIVYLKNIGTGTAFNVMSVLYGPESVVKNNKIIPAQNNEHWTWIMSSLGITDPHKPYSYNIGGSMYFDSNKQIGDYSFLAPAQPLYNPADQEPTYVCRVITTYHDIFKRKHASIFDFDLHGNWVMRAVLEDIPYDLHDLEGLKSPAPKTPLLKRLKKNVPRINISISCGP